MANNIAMILTYYSGISANMALRMSRNHEWILGYQPRCTAGVYGGMGARRI
jgi:hypothetical protein